MFFFCLLGEIPTFATSVLASYNAEMRCCHVLLVHNMPAEENIQL